MKKLNLIIFACLTLGTMYSCAPRVLTQVIKSYPALPDGEEVAVYERAKNDSIPAGAETLGSIAVIDNGFSTNGSFERVVELASAETRKNGGNGLLVTDHIKPSFWGSSVHQIGGVMLRVDKTDTVYVASREAYVSMEEESERKRIKIPAHTLFVNGGYGSLINRTKDLSREAKELEDKLSNGATYDLHYYYHHKNLPYGFGVMFSQFFSSPFSDVVFNGNKFGVRLDYVAASMSLRRAFSPNWIMGMYFGFGYLGYTQHVSDATNPINKGKITASTLGSHLGVGIEYKFSKHLGVAVDLTSVSGSFSSVELHNITLDPAPNISRENRMGASRLNATLGLRYYF